MEWAAFDSAQQLIQAGAEAARLAFPRIQAWIDSINCKDRPLVHAGTPVKQFGPHSVSA
jgi:hypothetical protein